MSIRWLKEYLYADDALETYAIWPTPACIVSDGAYGVGGFPGDHRTPEGLADRYETHVEAWSKHAHLSTTLWFWNTEIGWSTVLFYRPLSTNRSRLLQTSGGVCETSEPINTA